VLGSVVWAEEMNAKNKHFETGVVVYIKWTENTPPKRRVVIGCGTLRYDGTNRNFIVLYNVDDEPEVQKQRECVLATPGELVFVVFL